MLLNIRASQRGKFTRSLFRSTFAITVMFVGLNSLIPCPVDKVRANDSIIDERVSHKKTMKAQSTNLQEESSQKL